MDTENFIYTTNKGVIQSGGYKINNLFLNKNLPAVIDFQKGGANRAIPFGLFKIKQGYDNNIKPFKITTNNSDVINDNLFDKLSNMIEYQKGGKTAKLNKFKTRKAKKLGKKNKRKTKRK
jgi:hypothetical protein